MSVRFPARMPVMWAAMACTLPPCSAVAAPVLRSADIQIEMTSAITCEVTMALTVEGASEIEHRVDGLTVDLADVQGAERIGEPRAIGRTRSLVLRATHDPYTIRYRAAQPEDRAYRCPIWLPSIPTDGQTRSVRIRVSIPASAAARGSMPALTWGGTQGSTTLGHVPAFVHVPFGSTDAMAWDIARVMDVAAIAVFAGASALWVWRRRR